MKKLLNAIALGLVLALALSITFSNGVGTVTASGSDETTSGGNAGTTTPGGDSDEGNGGNSGNGGNTSGSGDVSGNNPGTTTPAQPEAETTGVTYGSTESDASNYTEDKVTTVMTDALNSNANVMKDALPEGKKLDLSKKDKIVVKASFSLKLEDGQKVPENGQVVVSGIAGLSTDRTYMAVHYHGDGTKEFHRVSLGADGKITIYGIKSFSDFVLIDVTDALVPTGDTGITGTTTPATTTTATNPAVSPKTGETVPVEVVVSLLALAGCATVGIKRARYSR